jgi:hypothetical protein
MTLNERITLIPNLCDILGDLCAKILNSATKVTKCNTKDTILDLPIICSERGGRQIGFVV